jgi:hypothetical protein
MFVGVCLPLFKERDRLSTKSLQAIQVFDGGADNQADYLHPFTSLGPSIGFLKKHPPYAQK